MKNKETVIYLLLILIGIISGFSYAYFTPVVIGNEVVGKHRMQAGNLILEYYGDEYISFEDAAPGEYRTETFTVENHGNKVITGYDINLSKIYNNFINDEIIISLTCSSSLGGSCGSMPPKSVPYSISDFSGSSKKIMLGNSISSGEMHTYTLKLEFIETNADQNYNQGAWVSFTITINDIIHYDGIIRETTGLSDTYAFYGIRDQIEEIHIGGIDGLNSGIYFGNGNELSINDYNNAIEKWDISIDQNGSLMAFIIPSYNDPSLYILGITPFGDDAYDTSLNANSSYLFANFTNLKYFVSYSDVYNIVKDASYMFYNCTNLVEIVFEGYLFETTNTTSMFENCSSLELLVFDIENRYWIRNEHYPHIITDYDNMFKNTYDDILITTQCSWSTTIDFLYGRLDDSNINGIIDSIDESWCE